VSTSEDESSVVETRTEVARMVAREVPATGRSVVSFGSLVERILAVPRKVRIVAVDGPAGSGKTTFARRLAGWAADAPVIHTDDFASWDQPLEWWPRMLRQVIAPLVDGHTAAFQRYDWIEQHLGEWATVDPAPIVIIEGVSSSRSEWAEHLALVVWIETDRDTRLQRGLDRDGDHLLELWQQWMAAEDRHFADEGSRDLADVVVDGDPILSHDPEAEFTAIG
jgi:uridine kinase